MKISQTELSNQAWFERYYSIPNPCNTYEEYLTATHHDLEEMSFAELKSEKVRVQMRLLYDKNPPAWLTERLNAIEETIKAYEEGMR